MARPDARASLATLRSLGSGRFRIYDIDPSARDVSLRDAIVAARHCSIMVVCVDAQCDMDLVSFVCGVFSNRKFITLNVDRRILRQMYLYSDTVPLPRVISELATTRHTDLFLLASAVRRATYDAERGV